jgi:hypothetical protein
MTNFWLIINLYRDTALVPKIGILHGDKNPARNLLCTATLVMLNKLSTMTAKTRAPVSLRSSGHGIPSLPTVTASCLKYQDRCPDGRRVTQTPYIAVLLGVMRDSEPKIN